MQFFLGLIEDSSIDEVVDKDEVSLSYFFPLKHLIYRRLFYSRSLPLKTVELSAR